MTVATQALRKRGTYEMPAGLEPTCTPISAPGCEVHVDA